MYSNQFLRNMSKLHCKTASVFVSKDCCNGIQSSSAIEAQFRQHAGSSNLAAGLRDGRSEASTVLKTLLRRHCKVLVRSKRSKVRFYLSLCCRIFSTLRCSYTCCFAVAILVASLQLYLLLRRGYTSCFTATVRDA